MRAFPRHEARVTKFCWNGLRENHLSQITTCQPANATIVVVGLSRAHRFIERRRIGSVIRISREQVIHYSVITGIAIRLSRSSPTAWRAGLLRQFSCHWRLANSMDQAKKAP